MIENIIYIFLGDCLREIYELSGELRSGNSVQIDRREDFDQSIQRK